MKQILRHTSLLTLALVLSACVITPDRSEERNLDKDLARVELEKSHRIPSLFSEHWFGTLVRIKDRSDRVIFSAKSKADMENQIHTLDLNPGTYTLLVLCRTHSPFKGSGSASLASKQVTLNAGETRKFGCEPHEYEEEARDGKKRTVYEVRLVDA